MQTNESDSFGSSTVINIKLFRVSAVRPVTDPCQEAAFLATCFCLSHSGNSKTWSFESTNLTPIE